MLVLIAYSVGVGILTAQCGKLPKASVRLTGGASMTCSAEATLVKNKNRHRPRMATVVRMDPMIRMALY